MIRTHFSAFTHFSVEAALAAYQGVVERGRRRSVAWVACSRRRSLVPLGLGPVSARVPRVRRRCVARRVGMASAHIKEQCTTTPPTTPSLGIRSRFPAGRRPTIPALLDVAAIPQQQLRVDCSVDRCAGRTNTAAQDTVGQTDWGRTGSAGRTEGTDGLRYQAQLPVLGRRDLPQLPVLARPERCTGSAGRTGSARRFLTTNLSGATASPPRPERHRSLLSRC